nr:MAG TPA: hypothetical protein [Caudoviricetes sp.]
MYGIGGRLLLMFPCPKKPKGYATNIFFLRDSLIWLSFLYSKSQKGADDISN